MTNTRYVDPDADAGGNGTTNALTGANCAYKSLSIWEAARQGVLTDIEECICESNGALHTADTTVCTINGWTTTPAYYIYIHTSAAGRHNGVYNTSKYRMEVTNDVDIHILKTNIPYVKIEGLQFKLTGATVGQEAITSLINDTWISQCIVVGLSGNANAINGIGVFSPDAGTTRIWNNIIYDFDTGGKGIRINSTNITAYLYNNTIHNCATGMSHAADGQTVVAINNLMKSCTDAASGIFAAGTDYNATDNVSMGYTATDGNDKLSRTFTFVNELGDDFHLASTDVGARNLGTDLSTDPNLSFSTDIDGQTRPGESIWDIGADEYIRTSDFFMFF